MSLTTFRQWKLEQHCSLDCFSLLTYQRMNFCRAKNQEIKSGSRCRVHSDPTFSVGLEIAICVMYFREVGLEFD
eukprot:jgi/Botrbrau1/17251/Bobra.0015s0010.1